MTFPRYRPSTAARVIEAARRIVAEQRPETDPRALEWAEWILMANREAA